MTTLSRLEVADARDADGTADVPDRDGELHVSVLVPTYRRVQLLEQCLVALGRQTKLPDEVVVVMRDDDQPTLDFAETFRPNGYVVRWVVVPALDATAARNRGVEVATGDIIAMTDDDAAPRPDWLARVCAHFADPRVGAVGGRDYVHQNGITEHGDGTTVGVLQWFGRSIGNHHLGTGAARDVEFLKGVNLSCRRTVMREVGFARDLRGGGAQYAEDVSLSLAVRRAGWRVVYDPAAAVDHYPGPLYLSDHRSLGVRAALRVAVHNETLTLLRYLPPARRVAFLVWSALVGTKLMPGIAAAVYLRGVQRTPGSFHRLATTLVGRYDGWRTWRHSPASSANESRSRVRAHA